MKMISENELAHVGVLGMKWGKRKGKSSWLKEAGKVTKNNLLHPIITDKADRESKKAGSFKDNVRRTLAYQSTKDLKDINSRVDKILADKKKMKDVNQKSINKGSSWLKEAGKVTMNNLVHPILTDKADRESKKAGSFKDNVRRTLVYQNTKDLKDINSRVNKMIADKKK